jgi:hypothetical protein
MTAEIPADKVARTRAAIESAMHADWVSASDIQSLLGLIGFCGQILVSGGWRTPWTVLAMRASVVRGYAPMNSMWAGELQWWVSLITEWNRTSIMLSPQLLLPTHAADMAPFTDASGSEAEGGGGAVFGRYATAYLFSSAERKLPICDLEGLVSVLWLTEVCERWPEQIQGKRFEAWCDNTTFVDCVNGHKSNAPSLAFLLGYLHSLMARFSFELRLKYVKSAENVAADALSREDWERFYSFMLSVGFQRSDIVWIPVQATLRNALSSRMLSMRSLKEAMQNEPRLPGSAE